MVGNLEHISADPDPQRLLDGAADGGSDPDGANIRSGILSARENSAVRSEAIARGSNGTTVGSRMSPRTATGTLVSVLPTGAPMIGTLRTRLVKPLKGATSTVSSVSRCASPTEPMAARPNALLSNVKSSTMNLPRVKCPSISSVRYGNPSANRSDRLRLNAVATSVIVSMLPV